MQILRIHLSKSHPYKKASMQHAWLSPSRQQLSWSHHQIHRCLNPGKSPLHVINHKMSSQTVFSGKSLGCLVTCRLVADHLVACHLVTWSFVRKIIWTRGHLVAKSYGRRVIWSQDHLVARSFGLEHLSASAWSRVI
jgi:hypothetical protein